MQPIRILYVNGGVMSRGGIESYMMNYYRHIDRKKIQIDFVVHGFEKGVYDDEIKVLGGRIYNVPVKSKNYFGNIKALKKIFLSGEYKIVHSHMDAMSMVVLKLAKKCGIPVRIAHSHNIQHLTNNKIKFILNEYARKNINRYSTHRFACSNDAGKWLFGTAKFNIVKNAIDIEKFLFNNELRMKYRKMLNIETNFVIGHIGRFDYQKNHDFIIDTFNEFSKRNEKACLLLIGDGHLKPRIEKKIKTLKLDRKISILPSCSNVNEIINCFDLFILPSLFEGLGMVAIEAQTNGVKCILSETTPKEVKITNSVCFLPLDTSKWVEYSLKEKIQRVKIDKNIIEDKGYSVKKESSLLELFYLNLEEQLYEN